MWSSVMGVTCMERACTVALSSSCNTVLTMRWRSINFFPATNKVRRTDRPTERKIFQINHINHEKQDDIRSRRTGKDCRSGTRTNLQRHQRLPTRWNVILIPAITRQDNKEAKHDEMERMDDFLITKPLELWPLGSGRNRMDTYLWNIVFVRFIDHIHMKQSKWRKECFQFPTNRSLDRLVNGGRGRGSTVGVFLCFLIHRDTSETSVTNKLNVPR